MANVHVKVIENLGLLKPDELSGRARSALLALLNDYYGIDALPRISYAPGGKPFFPDYPDIHFSLSHCRAAVMAVVGDTPVGCDIEDMVGEDEVEELADVACCEEERFTVLTSARPALEFTKLWTCKEALVKYDGIIPEDPRDWPSSAENIISRLAGDYVLTYCWR